MMLTALKNEPMESTEPKEPTEPMDRAEPLDPIDRIEFFDRMDSSDPEEPMLHFEGRRSMALVSSHAHSLQRRTALTYDSPSVRPLTSPRIRGFVTGAR